MNPGERNGKIVCPTFNGKTCTHFRPENPGAPGALPCCYGAPVGIGLEKRIQVFQIKLSNLVFQNPRLGQGWARGVWPVVGECLVVNGQFTLFFCTPECGEVQKIRKCLFFPIEILTGAGKCRE